MEEFLDKIKRVLSKQLIENENIDLAVKNEKEICPKIMKELYGHVLKANYSVRQKLWEAHTMVSEIKRCKNEKSFEDLLKEFKKGKVNRKN